MRGAVLLGTALLAELILLQLLPRTGPGISPDASRVLHAAKRAVLEHYETRGTLPPDGTELAVADLWGRRIVFSGSRCVSPGPNGVVEAEGPSDDLSLPFGQEELSASLRDRTRRALEEARSAYASCGAAEDERECIRRCKELYRGREQAECMKRCRRSGGGICLSDGFGCVRELVAAGCLQGRHAYDGWGTPLWFSAAQQTFRSCGSDLACGTADDVL